MLKKYITNHSFGIMISALMSAIMLSINVFMMEGFTLNSLRTIGLMYVPIFLIALIISTYIVGPIVHPIIKRVTNKYTKTIVNILLMTLFMVTGMATLMSLSVVILTGPHEAGIISTWLHALARNYPIAFLVQFLAVGPFVRFVHETLLAPPAPQETAEAISTN